MSLSDGVDAVAHPGEDEAKHLPDSAQPIHPSEGSAERDSIGLDSRREANLTMSSSQDQKSDITQRTYPKKSQTLKKFKSKKSKKKKSAMKSSTNTSTLSLTKVAEENLATDVAETVLADFDFDSKSSIWKCDVCQSSFPESEELATHLASHGDLKRFRCKLCGARFTQK